MEGLQLIYDSRGLYLWLALLILTVALLAYVAILQSRLNSFVSHYRRLMRGAVGGNFDSVMERQIHDIEDTSARLDELDARSVRLESTLAGCLQHIGVVRFNPFDDVGGDQSFSVVLLNAKGDGIALSSLFGRRESRVYLKPIEAGVSKYALSDEEEEAMRLAEEKQQSRPRHR